MTTLSSMTVRLGIDTNPLRAGAERARSLMRRLGSDMGDDGDGSGRNFGGRMASALGRSLRSGMSSAIDTGMSGLRGLSSAISSNPYVAAGGAIMATTIVGTALPMIGALFGAAVVSVGGLAVIGVAAALLKEKPAVKKAASDLKSTVTKILKKAAEPLAPAFVKSLKAFKGTAQKMTPEIQAIFENMQPAIPELTKGIQDGLTEAIKGFRQMMAKSKPVFEGLRTMITKIGEGVGEFFRQVGKNPEEMKLALEDFGAALGWAIGIAGQFIAGLTVAYGKVRWFVTLSIAAFQWLYDFMMVTIPGMIYDIVAWFLSLPRRIIGVLSAFVASVVAWFTTMYRRATSWVSRTVTRIVQFLRSLPGKAASAISSLASKVYEKVKHAGNRMKEAASSGVSKAVAAVRKLPGKAKEALGRIGSKLYGAGESLVKGFIRGIKSAFGAVKRTLGSLTSMLPDWKGPETLDKKLLTPAGRMVIGGFMRGIDQEVPSLRKQLHSLTGDVPGMAVSLTPRGVLRSSDQTETRVVLDVTGGDEEMKRLIRRMVRTDGRGNVQTAFG